jgi:hypothetical protein
LREVTGESWNLRPASIGENWKLLLVTLQALYVLRGDSVDSVQDLVINIVAAVIVFVAGVGARSLLGYVRSWRGRAFWGRKMLRGRTHLFVGVFNRFNHLEPSGFIGGGDSHAVHELATALGRLGSSFKIAYASHVSDGQMRENLILLGLDQVNSLTSRLFSKINCGFRIDVDAMTIVDQSTGETYGAEWEVDPPEDSTLREFDASWFISVGPDGERYIRRFRTDYGLLIRGQNPFAPDRSLVLMAGLYGFGTWAAARLPLDPHFQRRCAGLHNFECLFRVEVHQGQILATSIVCLRPLPTLPKPFSVPSTDPVPTDHSGPPIPCAPGDSLPIATADDRSEH